MCGPEPQGAVGYCEGERAPCWLGGRDVMDPGSGRLGWADALPSFPEETIWVGEGYK